MVGIPGQTYAEEERSLRQAFASKEAATLRDALPQYFASLGLSAYVTWTFKPRRTRSGKLKRPKGEWARKCLLTALNRLNRRLFGRTWQRDRVGAFGVLCWEKHADGHPHVHAMVGGVERVPRRDLELYFAAETGWCDWHPITAADERVARYISKYITKDADADLWEFYGVFDGRRVASRSSPGALFQGEARGE